MARVLITGAKGTIGRRLSGILRQQGHEVRVLTRHKTLANEFEWDWSSGFVEEEALKNVDHIIHLAGETIGKRWTSSRKKLIYESRVRSIQLLYDKVRSTGSFPKTFISASAVGYYGIQSSEQEFTENDKCRNDFLAKVCCDLEKTADDFMNLNIRVVKLRTGIVISNEKTGFLHELKQTMKFGFLVVAGDGKQFVPWIHLDDLCNMYIKAIGDTNFQGPINAVSPEHITNREIVEIIKKRSGNRPLILKIPAFLIKLIFGEMAQLLLTGNRVSNKLATQLGISFRYDSFNKCFDE